MVGISSFPELYRAARGGDVAAGGRLLVTARKRLLAFIRRHMGPEIRRRVEADDIHQETAMTVLRRLPRWPEDLCEGEFLARVYRIARWQIADVMKSADARTLEGPMKEVEPAGEGSGTGPVTKADDRRRLREWITTLPPTYADVLRLVDVEGIPSAEAAAALGLTPVGLRQRLSRARALLRRHAGNGV